MIIFLLFNLKYRKLEIYLFYKMKILGLSHFLRPPPPHPVPKFPGNFGTGDVLLSYVSQSEFQEILGQDILASIRCDFLSQNSSWTSASSKALERMQSANGPAAPPADGRSQAVLTARFAKQTSFFRAIYSGRFRSHEFSEKFGTGALGVKF